LLLYIVSYDRKYILDTMIVHVVIIYHPFLD
jgi:hypothetical protein